MINTHNILRQQKNGESLNIEPFPLRIFRLSFLGILIVFAFLAAYICVYKDSPEYYEPVNFTSLPSGTLFDKPLISPFGFPLISPYGFGSDTLAVTITGENWKFEKHLHFQINTGPQDWAGVTFSINHELLSESFLSIRWRGRGDNYRILVDITDGSLHDSAGALGENWYAYFDAPPNEWTTVSIPLTEFQLNPVQNPKAIKNGKFDLDKVQGISFTFYPGLRSTLDIQEIRFVTKSNKWSMTGFFIIVLLWGFLLWRRTISNRLLTAREWDIRNSKLLVRIIYLFYVLSIIIALWLQLPYFFSLTSLSIQGLLFLLILIDEIRPNTVSTNIIWQLRYLIVLIAGWYLNFTYEISQLIPLLCLAFLPAIQSHSRRLYLSLPAVALLAIIAHQGGNWSYTLLLGTIIIGILTIALIFLQEILERSKAHREAQYALSLYAEVLENTSDAVYIVNSDGTVERINSGFESLTGYRSHEVVGRALTDFVLQEDAQLVLSTFQSDFQREPRRYDLRFVNRQGEIRYAIVRETPLFRNDLFKGHQAVATDITDRKRVEAELFNSRQMLQTVLNTIPQRVFWKDRDSIFVGCNKSMALDSGYSDPDQLIGKTDYETASAKTADLYRADDQQVIKTGQPKLNYEEPQIKSDGSQRWLRTSKVPLRDKNDRVIGVLGTYEDITEHKQAEESLKRERNMFRVLIDNLPDAIYVKDIECRKTIANVADVRIMGKQSEAEVLGKTDFDIYAAEIAAGFYADDLSVIQSGKSVLNKEEFFFNKDGKKNWLLTFKLPMRDEQDRIIGLVGIGREITEQKRTMEALTLLSHTVKSIGESISITDLKNNIIFVNEAFLRTYGYTEQELIGKSIGIVSCDPVTHEQMVLSETIKGGWQGELLNRKKDGTLFSISLSSSVVYDDKNQPIALVGVATDITERKRTEEALYESEERFRIIAEQTGRLVYDCRLETDITIWAGAIQEVTGLTSGEFQTTTIIDWQSNIHPEDLDYVVSYLDEAKKTVSHYRIEYRYRRADGEYIYIEDHGVYLSNESGKTYRVLGAIANITERKRAEIALRESMEKFRMIFENASDGINIIEENPDESKRKLIECNNRFAEITGRSREELLRMGTIYSLMKNVSHEYEHKDIQLIGLGVPFHGSGSWIRPDGKYNIIEYTGVQIEMQGKICTIGIDRDVTQRKQAEEALRESEEKLRNIVEHSTNLFYSRNTDQVFTYLSPQAKDIFDCEPDEALVRFTDFMTDNPINKLGCELAEKAIQNCARQEAYELELMSRKGRRVWVEIQEAPVVKDGKTISIVGAATDITERRWAEMALQVSEKKYRDIVTWAPIGIFQTTHSGKLLTANKGIVEMLGYENMSELIGCDMGKKVYYDEKDRERLIARHDTSGENISLNSETRWKRKNGSLIWVLMTVHDVRDKSSEILYYEGFVFDITERKHAEESLRESEERFRLLVENSTDIVTEINAEDKYLYVSPNVKSILDFEPLDLVGTDILSRVYGKDKSAIGEFLSKLGGSATYRYRDRSGGWHWFESSGRVYYTSSGEQRMVMVSRDITQRRKAEQQLEVSRKQLQHFTEHLEYVLEEERKRISRELHDELGQLLTILKFDLSWLKLEGSHNDANIIARIDAMMESVNEALASVKRISKEIRPPQLEALGLIGAIQWDIDQVEKKTGLKSIVTVEPAEVEIKGQVSTVLYRVFREALTNVLRHADATHVFIRLSQRLDSIFLIIRDNGRGITKKELKGTKSLGLVGIRERLRMVGGTFTIEGKTGSGTILSVEVPLKKKKGDSKS
ncbi:MAG: CIA30 family protein [Ignavibacteriales bacterium]|nr:CIA30 family protein [Ignavibacteriales bacterium]